MAPQCNENYESAVVSASLDPQQTYDDNRDVVIVVDPFSTGFNCAREIYNRGYDIIAVWTAGLEQSMKTCTSSDRGDFRFFGEIEQQKTLEQTKQRILDVVGPSRNVVGCLVGAESGVDYADALSEYLGVRTNGTEIGLSRRDKHVQQELVKAAGLRSCREAVGSVFEDVSSFLRAQSFPVVLKPTNGACSDGVKLCQSYDEAKEHFEHLMAAQNVYGGAQNAVLCQEFLRGKEYVVDHVSRDGVHKTAMIWVYDKRPANGSAFVYYGMKPVDPTSKEGRVLVEYTRGVLDAINIKNGPTHGEIMMSSAGEPCLVEMNCRAHGWNGIWMSLARALTGNYSQIDMTADALLDEVAFRNTPDVPAYPFQASGEIVMLVSHKSGEVVATPGYDVLRSLPSYVLGDGLSKVGSVVTETVDLMSAIGSLVVMHPNSDVVKKDIEFIRHMETINGFFRFKEEEAGKISQVLPVEAHRKVAVVVKDYCNEKDVECIRV